LGVGNLKNEMKEQTEKIFQTKKQKPSTIVYEHVYVDGSVDTEYTFTLPIEDADLIEDIARVFYDICAHRLYLSNYSRTISKLNKETSNRLFYDLITNSGVHLTLMEESDYNGYENRHTLDQAGLERVERFVRNAYMLLYYISTPFDFTRQIMYRNAFVGNTIYDQHNFSPSNDEKQSMIYTHNRSMFEFRIFDPVFQREEYVRNYILIMSKIMDIYKNNVKEEDIVIPELDQSNYRRKVNDFFSNRMFVELNTITNDKDLMTVLFTQINKFGTKSQKEKVNKISAVLDNDLIDKKKAFAYMFKDKEKLTADLNKLKI